jgi:hypothetical protein
MLFSILFDPSPLLSHVYYRNPMVIDGCATFFGRDKFSHVKKHEVKSHPDALLPAAYWLTYV